MKPKQLMIYILSVILILTSSCQKEDDYNENNITQNGARLKRILLYSSIDSETPLSIIEEYEYDEENRVSKVSSPMYEEGEIVGMIKYDLYKYNVHGQLEKIENFNANSNSPTGFINLKKYTYTYSNNGKKEKEYIEYPQIGSSAYTLYKYDKGKLSRIEKYERNSDDLESYVINKYDNSGNLVRETSFSKDNIPSIYKQHSFENGLNVRTDIFGGEDMEEQIREIINTYDEKNNLIIKESNELSPYSSMMSHVLKYEYFED